MKNEHFKDHILFRLAVFCCTMIVLIILNSCAFTYAHLETDEPSEEIGTIYEDTDDSTEEYEPYELESDLPEESDEPTEEYVYEPEEPEEWPERVVFLTFDDGPSRQTAALLDILYEEDVPATFFVLGHSIINNTAVDPQALMARILAEGHYLGLHSMTHDYSTLYSGEGAADRFVAEMFELQAKVYDMVGHHTNLCRAPFGMMTGFRPGHHVAVDEAGINCIDWNIDPQDWRDEYNVQIILDHVIRQVEMLNFPPELVIVLHEYGRTVESLPLLIAFLREHGYVFKPYIPGHEFIYDQYQQ